MQVAVRGCDEVNCGYETGFDRREGYIPNVPHLDLFAHTSLQHLARIEGRTGGTPNALQETRYDRTSENSLQIPDQLLNGTVDTSLTVS